VRRRDDPLFQSLVEEVDQAIINLQAARRLIADIERRADQAVLASQTLRQRERDAAAALSAGPSLRYAGMTVAEAALALGVGEEHVRRLLRRGELVGVPFGGRIGWRLSRDYVEQLIAEWRRAELAKAEARATRERDAAKRAAPARHRRPRKGAR